MLDFDSYKFDNFFKRISYIFKKTRIRFLGRSGLEFNNDKAKYYIDSEMLIDCKYDIVLYQCYLLVENQKHKLDKKENKIIIKQAQLELEKMGLKVDDNNF